MLLFWPDGLRGICSHRTPGLHICVQVAILWPAKIPRAMAFTVRKLCTTCTRCFTRNFSQSYSSASKRHLHEPLSVKLLSVYSGCIAMSAFALDNRLICCLSFHAFELPRALVSLFPPLPPLFIIALSDLYIIRGRCYPYRKIGDSVEPLTSSA